MKYILFSLLLVCSLIVSGQKIKLINAQSRSWSGGQAGRSGTNYSVTIQCIDTNIILDTLWVGTSYTKITIPKGYYKKQRTVTINLQVGQQYNSLRQNQINDTIKKPTKQYKGEALISYRYRGEEYSFIVQKLTKLPGICYP